MKLHVVILAQRPAYRPQGTCPYGCFGRHGDESSSNTAFKLTGQVWNQSSRIFVTNYPVVFAPFLGLPLLRIDKDLKSQDLEL